MTRRGGNGWRDGSDPILRYLRTLTVLVALGAFVWLVVQRGNELDDIATLALVLGVVLVLLGYEGVVRLPILGGRQKDDDDDR